MSGIRGTGMTEADLAAEWARRPGATMAEVIAAARLRERDRIAELAMQGWLASFAGTDCTDPAGVAAFAYRMADAMLAEREKASPAP